MGRQFTSYAIGTTAARRTRNLESGRGVGESGGSGGTSEMAGGPEVEILLRIPGDSDNQIGRQNTWSKSFPEQAEAKEKGQTGRRGGEGLSWTLPFSYLCVIFFFSIQFEVSIFP